MTDIFISYKREEQPLAKKLAHALQRKGWTVWWDPELRAGEHFDDAIERALNDSKCVIVMWSKLSVKSRFVKDEATYALDENKLVPVAIEECNLPFRFRYIHTAQLISWDGSGSSTELQKLVHDISKTIGEPPVEVEKRRREQEEERKRIEKEVRKAEEERRQKAYEIVRKAADSIKHIVLDEEQQKREATPKTFTNSIGMKFVLIPAGSFMMGSKLSPKEVEQKFGGEAKDYESEHPRHKVTLSQPFYLQTSQVTQGQWQKVMDNNPSWFEDCGDDCQVEHVSWNDAQDFIKKLNEMEGDNNYRLPTEAEWEYACRAGSTTEFFFGDDEGKLGEYAWYRKNSDQKTHPVGQKEPNSCGLYDMHGNIFEWVYDDFHVNYEGVPTDGRAWIDEPRYDIRVVRGGSWGSDAQYCRSAYRGSFLPDSRNDFVGFRLVRSVTLDS